MGPRRLCLRPVGAPLARYPRRLGLATTGRSAGRRAEHRAGGPLLVGRRCDASPDRQHLAGSGHETTPDDDVTRCGRGGGHAARPPCPVAPPTANGCLTNRRVHATFEVARPHRAGDPRPLGHSPVSPRSPVDDRIAGDPPMTRRTAGLAAALALGLAAPGGAAPPQINATSP